MSTKKKHSKLWLYLSGIIALTGLAVFLLLAFFWFLANQQIIPIHPRFLHPPILWFLLGCIILGSSVSFFIGHLIIRPIQKMSEAFDQLSKGDFSVTVSTDEKLEEIREMAEHFNAMAFDLSHIETLQSDFVTNVSHEFKTPIAAIEGYATLLQSTTLSEEKREDYLDKIIANSRKLSDLSSNILALAKLENQETVMHQRIYRLDEQLRKNILLLEEKWTEKAIEFDLDLPQQNYCGNEPLLDMVWFNLLDNAIKHSPQGGTISVLIRTTSSSVRVDIKDSGDGMSEEIQKHIFEKFYQGDSSRTDEGNGLGLALVKRIIDLCHGNISVVSAPMQGAVFSITLPLEAQK